MTDLTKLAQSDLRGLRDILLQESDWIMIPDVPFSESEKEEWRIYRQNLRDLPANSPNVRYSENGQLEAFSLPVKPSLN